MCIKCKTMENHSKAHINLASSVILKKVPKMTYMYHDALVFCSATKRPLFPHIYVCTYTVPGNVGTRGIACG